MDLSKNIFQLSKCSYSQEFVSLVKKTPDFQRSKIICNWCIIFGNFYGNGNDSEHVFPTNKLGSRQTDDASPFKLKFAGRLTISEICCLLPAATEER